MGHVLSDGGAYHEHPLKVRGPMPLDVDGLVSRLSSDAALKGFSVLPRDE